MNCCCLQSYKNFLRYRIENTGIYRRSGARIWFYAHV
nr:MAG TPA: hypothetical protein [Caudoviricetes sp.]